MEKERTKIKLILNIEGVIKKNPFNNNYYEIYLNDDKDIILGKGETSEEAIKNAQKNITYIALKEGYEKLKKNFKILKKISI